MTQKADAARWQFVREYGVQISQDHATKWPCVYIADHDVLAEPLPHRPGLLCDVIEEEVIRAKLDDAIDELRRQVHDALGAP